MSSINFDNIDLPTPCFFYDMDAIHARLEKLDEIASGSPLRILYSIKSACFSSLLSSMKNHVHGFATSSLFESRLASELLDRKGSVHLSSVAITPEQIDDIKQYCDYVHFNSLSQMARYRHLINDVKYGLRINPKTAYVDDDRYDPCRSNSKLGVAIEQFVTAYMSHPGDFSGLSGLQFHNNCASDDLAQLTDTCETIMSAIGKLVEQISWINIGGGYLFDETSDLHELKNVIEVLSSGSINRIFFEPGKAIVGNTGYLACSVVDIFESDSKQIAVLDCSVNHLPEVFEYQYQPEMIQHNKQGKYAYRLVGNSCLSGDLFGDYLFEQALHPGDRFTFTDVGAYMYVKASMFNGLNLPSVYLYEEEKGFTLIKQHGYQDYLVNQC